MYYDHVDYEDDTCHISFPLNSKTFCTIIKS